MKKYFCSLVFLLPVISFGQQIEKQVISSTSGELKSNTSTIDFVIGEALVTTHSSKTGTISEGFLQGYEIFAIPLSDNKQELDEFEFSVYPNPTINDVEISTTKTIEYSYNLITTDGRFLETKQVNTTNERVNLSKYQPGVYYLSLYNDSGEFKKFKIVKH